MTTDDLLPQMAAEVAEECDPLLEATLEFEESARYLDLEPWIVHRLRHMEREITVNLPLIREHGEVTTATGLRVQHYTGLGPTLGAVRFSPEAHLATLRAQAMAMTLQLALLQLPFGGGAGAVVCNPEELSERELQTLAKDYVYALRGIVGPFRDILIPAVGCNQQTMAWMLDAQTSCAGRMETAAVTGKPAALWGVPGYYGATACGIVALLRKAFGQRNTTLEGKRIALQGFGALGSSVAKALYDAGARIVALADISGSLYNNDGINIDEVSNHAAHDRILFGYPDAEAVCNADVLEADCEALVLAAHERQVTAANVQRIRASLVLEAHLGAVTQIAGVALEHGGIELLPELLTNAGAALAAFAEWKHNTGVAGRVFRARDLDAFISERVMQAYEAASQAAEQHSFGLRRAAHFLALERIGAAMRLRQ